jgi:hypothetical protein
MFVSLFMSYGAVTCEKVSYSSPSVVAYVNLHTHGDHT